MTEIARITVTYKAYMLLEGHDLDSIEGASWDASTEVFERDLRDLLTRAYPSARIDVIPSPNIDAVEIVAHPTVRRDTVADVDIHARDRVTQMV